MRIGMWSCQLLTGEFETLQGRPRSTSGTSFITMATGFIAIKLPKSSDDVARPRKMHISAKPWICTRCTTALMRGSRGLPRTNIDRQRRAYTEKPRGHDGRPFRMAVIGSGPAGFYTAYKVMAKIENSVVDMYEHLPVPFGLVRFGVAPDHPEVKVGSAL
jgi:hypothetical protein